MPIGQAAYPVMQNVVAVPLLTAGEDITVHQAVAIVDVTGAIQAMLCGATTFGPMFSGFAYASAESGNALLLLGPGSVVTPVVTGGGPLVPNTPVYLSGTPGEVTHTPPSGSGVTIQPLGWAVSTTQIFFSTGYKVQRA